MNVAMKHKYIDILSSLMLNGISSLTLMVGRARVRVDILTLLRDTINSTDRCELGNLSKAVRKQIMRLITQTDGKPYGYKCAFIYLVDKIDVEFVEIDNERTHKMAPYFAMWRSKGKYMPLNKLNSITLLHTSFTPFYDANIAKAIATKGTEILRKTAENVNAAVQNFAKAYSPVINLVNGTYVKSQKGVYNK